MRLLTQGESIQNSVLQLKPGQALELVKHALSLNGISLCGFHCHIGSQIFDPEPFLDAAEIMLKFIRDVRAQTSYNGDVLNLGGGFGVRYVDTDPVIDYRENIRVMSEQYKKALC